MKKVAIFDIDGTVFRSSLVIELTEALIQAGIFPSSARKIYEESLRKWLDRKGEYGEYIDDVVLAFGRHIRGKDVARVNSISEKVVKFHGNKVYRFTRDLVKELRKKKYFIVAISYSPLHTVKTFAQRFGFHEVFGTVYESKNGKFTGVNTRIAKDKSGILRYVLQKKGFSLKNSVGVGDTESDTSFLKMVDKPICFNPNRKLLKRAKRSGWRVVVERKDVIYEI